MPGCFYLRLLCLFPSLDSWPHCFFKCIEAKLSRESKPCFCGSHERGHVILGHSWVTLYRFPLQEGLEEQETLILEIIPSTFVGFVWVSLEGKEMGLPGEHGWWLGRNAISFRNIGNTSVVLMLIHSLIPLRMTSWTLKLEPHKGVPLSIHQHMIPQSKTT